MSDDQSTELSIKPSWLAIGACIIFPIASVIPSPFRSSTEITVPDAESACFMARGSQATELQKVVYQDGECALEPTN